MQVEHDVPVAVLIDRVLLFLLFFSFHFHFCWDVVKGKSFCSCTLSLLCINLWPLCSYLTLWLFPPSHLTGLKSLPFSRCLASHDCRVSEQCVVQSHRPSLGQCALSLFTFYKSIASPWAVVPAPRLLINTCLHTVTREQKLRRLEIKISSALLGIIVCLTIHRFESVC